MSDASGLTRRSVRFLVVALAVVALGACSRPGFLIRTVPAVQPLFNGSRAELATRVAELEQSTSSGSLSGGDRDKALAELERLSRRLNEGDFQVGDQLVITTTVDAVSVDTASVREGMVVSFAALPEASVAGILRTELQGRLQDHVDKYVKQATVRVNILTRLQITGGVGRPGFYNISPDRPVSEIIMLAGGTSQLSDLDKVFIRRDGKVIVKPSMWKDAVNSGVTVAQLGLVPGDAVDIGVKKQRNWPILLRSLLFIVPAIVGVIQLLRIIYGE